MSEERISQLKELIDAETEGTVLSVFCRTDPRDPANTGETPGWQIALKNGLKAAEAKAEKDGERAEAMRKLARKVEDRITGASAHDRGRSVAMFLSADGKVDYFHTFQIPVRRDMVEADHGPVVWPMVDVIDRGQQTGLVLMSHDRIRLLEWADGHAEDLEYSVYDLELGDWRDYRGPAPANPARAQQSASHAESYSDRVEAWRSKFSKAAAANIADSASDLGMKRLVIAADGDLGKDFVEALPQGTRDLVVAQVATNLIDMSAAEAADHLDPHLREAWKEKVNAIAADAVERSRAGGKGAVGPDEVMLALAEGRVEHLLLDPYLELDERDLSEGARQAITDAGEASFREAAVEAAIRTHAAVSSASVDEVPALAENQGIVALLRY